MADTLTLVVPTDLENERVDKAVATLLGVSRAVARDLVTRGVLLDGRPVKASDRVLPGAVLVTPAVAETVALEPEPVEFEVIHEDPSLIVVDKPPGLVVHPGAGTRKGTLAAGLLARYPELEGVGEEGRWGLVHRLDRDTSGVLLVARSQQAYRRLTTDLAARRIGRSYVALVHGAFATQTGKIEAPIGPDPNRPTRRAVVSGGKPAVTHYEVLEGDLPGVSLLEVRLETGRTHQIRVHMAAIGHPVVGDRLYSSLTEPIAVPRIFLHAARVTLDHPDTGEEVSYTAPLPPDLEQVLAELSGSGPG